MMVSRFRDLGGTRYLPTKIACAGSNIPLYQDRYKLARAGRNALDFATFVCEPAMLFRPFFPLRHSPSL